MSTNTTAKNSTTHQQNNATSAITNNTSLINSTNTYSSLFQESTLSSSSIGGNIAVAGDTNQSSHATLKIADPKPFKMNTYIQLEIDQSNFNSLPRVCKFLVTKLQIQADEMTQISSVILAVKLQVSKRSLRTLEIPVQPSSSSTTAAEIDLDLNYNITYPHYLKKDTNILYFYIQKRKKYKTKKILGYKTMAYTFIDLATVLQRPFTNNLPLIQAAKSGNGRNSERQSSHRESASGKNSGKQQIVGYLTVQSLVSVPTDMSDEISAAATQSLMPMQTVGTNSLQMNENSANTYSTPSHFGNNNNAKTFMQDDELADDIDCMNQLYSDNEADATGGPGCILINQAAAVSGGKARAASSSLVASGSHHHHQNKQDNFKLISSLTRSVNGKIISFLRKKLKTDDKETVQSPGEAGEDEESTDPEDAEVEDEEEEEEEEEDEADIEDPDFYNVEQVSDYYTDSDEEQDEDSYSIVSTPKPKLQPFFSQPYLDILNSKQNELKFLLIDHMAVSSSEQTDKDEYFINLITKSLHCILINNLSEFIQLIDLINKQKKSEPIKIILFCSERYLNKYLKLYLDLIKFNDSFAGFFKHYFIPRKVTLVNGTSTAANITTTSILANYLGNCNHFYNSLFLDELWANATSSNNIENSNEILNRLSKYVNCSQETVMPLQIGEVMLNDEVNSKFIPFLVDIRIGTTANSEANNEIFSEQLQLQQQQLPSPSLAASVSHKSILSSSNSMPHFAVSNNMQSPSASNMTAANQTGSSGQKSLNNNRYSPPNSPVTSLTNTNSEENGAYNLQLDYWTNEQYSSGVSGSSALNNPIGKESSVSQSSNLSQQFNQQLNLNSNSSVAASFGSKQEQSTEKGSKMNQKSSVKASFKNVHVYREQMIKCANGGPNGQLDMSVDQSLSINYVLKEKKQKIMRIGKKAKDFDFKRETVEGVTRLVCTSRNQTIPLNVLIDDLEYNSVKFLQISSLWQGKNVHFNLIMPFV